MLRCTSEAGSKMPRIYADVNQQMPRSYWDYDSMNITWGVLENYEVVRNIGECLRAAQQVKAGR
jgi:casein kinase II subunit alpha